MEPIIITILRSLHIFFLFWSEDTSQICIYYSFEDKMTSKEIGSLSNSIRYCYARNKISDMPIHFSATGLSSQTFANLKKGNVYLLSLSAIFASKSLKWRIIEPRNYHWVVTLWISLKRFPSSCRYFKGARIPPGDRNFSSHINVYFRRF